MAKQDIAIIITAVAVPILLPYAVLFTLLVVTGNWVGILLLSLPAVIIFSVCKFDTALTGKK